MKYLLLPLLFLQLSLVAHSQQTFSTEIIGVKNGKPTEWVAYLDLENFKIEYKFADCDPPSGLDNESVLFRFVNKTAANIVMSWHLHISYDEVCRTCDFPEEYSYELIVGPNETIEGNCLNDADYRLKVFSRFIDPVYTKGAQLTGLKLANFTVSNTID